MVQQLMHYKDAHIYSNLLTCNIPFLECHSHCESKRWFLAWYNCWPSWVYQYPNSLTTVKERDSLLEKCRSKPTGHYSKTVSFSMHDSSHFINPCNSSLKYTVKIFVLSSTHICMYIMYIQNLFLRWSRTADYSSLHINRFYF